MRKNKDANEDTDSAKALDEDGSLDVEEIPSDIDELESPEDDNIDFNYDDQY